jgi:hypothetical protein
MSNRPELAGPTTLTLALFAEYFHAIKEGRKPLEYRLRNDYWAKRLKGRTYDRIVLTLGYPKAGDESRRIVLPWRGYIEQTIVVPLLGKAKPVDVYAIWVSEPPPAS